MFHVRNALAALLLAATAHAEIKSERLPAATNLTFSMSARDLPAADAVAAFIQQTGINVIYERGGGDPGIGGPAVVYDVEFKNVSRDQAVKEIARALSLGVSRMGSNSPPRLSPNSWSGESERRPERAVELAYLTRNQSFPASRNRQNGLNLQFRVWGGRRPIDGPVQVKLDEATDDQGRSLLMPERGRTFHQDFDSERYMVDSTVQLQLPDPPPKKLATLKGSAVMSRPKTILRLTIDALADGPQSGDLNGATVTVGPAKRNGSQYNLPIVIARGKLGNEAWQQMQMRVNQLRSSVIAKGAKGEMLQLQANSWGSDGRKLTIDSTVITPDENGNPSSAADPIAPAVVQWDSVVETTDEVIPFSLTNIQIP